MQCSDIFAPCALCHDSNFERLQRCQPTVRVVCCAGRRAETATKLMGVREGEGPDCVPGQAESSIISQVLFPLSSPPRRQPRLLSIHPAIYSSLTPGLGIESGDVPDLGFEIKSKYRSLYAPSSWREWSDFPRERKGCPVPHESEQSGVDSRNPQTQIVRALSRRT